MQRADTSAGAHRFHLPQCAGNLERGLPAAHVETEPRGIEPERVVGELAYEQPTVLRASDHHSDVRLAFGQ